MQLTISQSTLSRELAVVAGAAEKRGSIPILANVHLAAGPDGITLSATNLEQALISRVACDVKQTGAICLPAARLLALVRVLSGDIAISTDDKQYATVKAGRSRSRIAGMSTESWPELPTAPDALFSMDARALSRTFGRVAFAISQEESRFTINGALLVVECAVSGGAVGVRTVATDGHRLALAEEVGAGAASALKLLVPKAAITHYAKLADMAEGGEMAQVSADENHLFFSVGNRSLVARKLTGNFPDYQRVLPKYEQYVSIDVAELKGAIQRVAQFADERSKAVRVTLSAGEITLTAATAESGESEESVPCDGELALELGLNAQYILDALGAVSHERVALFAKDSKSAVEIRPMRGTGKPDDPYTVATDGRVVIMPLRL